MFSNHFVSCGERDDSELAGAQGVTLGGVEGDFTDEPWRKVFEVGVPVTRGGWLN
jgi:hypothetical protein